MIQFFDNHNNRVELAFAKNAFPEEPLHVLVICKYEGSWLLTKHKKRGMEFPGGKRERGETLEEAARREAYEETGAVFGQLTQIAEYKVFEEKNPFVKAVFWGKVKFLEKSNHYFETNGPVLVDENLLKQRFGQDYSFIMKDQVVEECIKYILQDNQKE
ncbi:RNA deprotection pyrophosphohydrolase [Neobacillus mesonae]|uniref:RNA deprotection pyrophosphohydrolase n=1 Tax=Neobacillus mesonae TaxID=1193713 RepID=UPI00203EE7FA|nr:nucleoside triphosphatase YtkD [Neobacillus mesonae]MCM3571239.1 nucleoside triphosphatase YtkD [Neobacillus mesonae]